jgi:hypothetical protein
VIGAEPPDVAFKELPPLWDGYKVDPYIRAAIALQGMGRERAVARLKAWANRGADERLIVLCRMLFTARPGAEFRRPLLGGAVFIGTVERKDANYKNWPLEPIEIIDGIPFNITRSYVLHGVPEPPDSYLAYCVEQCDWTKFRFRAKSRADKAAALKKLMSQEKVKGKLDGREVEFLEAQLK